MVTKKNTILLCLSVFLLVVGTGVVAPLLAPFAKDIGATGIWVGMLYSGFYMVRLVIGTPIGRLSDTKGPKAILTYSLLLYPLIGLSYALASNFASLLGARLLHGVASAMMLPMAMAYMAEISPRGREGKYMGIYNTLIFIANGAGPLLGGYLAANYGTQQAFFSLCILSVCSLMIIFLLPSSRKTTLDHENASSHAQNASPPKVKVWNNRGVLALAVINVIVAVLSIFMVSFFTLYADSRHLNEFAIGFLIALNNIVIGASQLPLGWMVDRYNKVKLVIISALLTVVILSLFPWVHALWSIALLMILVGLSSAVTLASSSALSAVIGRTSGMGVTMGFLGSATSLGMVIGPLLSGLLVDLYQIEITFYFSALLWALGTAAFAVLWSQYSHRALKNTNHVEGISNVQ